MGMHEHIGKNIYYEEAMRIPMMISWPEKITPRRDSTLMIAFADLYPSLLSLMGFKDRIPAEVTDFRPVRFYPLTGEYTGDRTALLLSSP